jgi:hypothetical protein
MRSALDSPFQRRRRLPSAVVIPIVLLALAATPRLPGAETVSWTGTANDTLWSTGGNWSTGLAPGPEDNVRFVNDGTSGATLAAGGNINNVVDVGFLSSINSLSYGNIFGFHNTSLVNPLVVQSDSATNIAFLADDGQPAVFYVGSGVADGANDIVYASMTGGSLFVSNVHANLSVMQASVTSGGHRATLDLTGVSSFTCVVSNILVGHDFGVPITRPTGTLILGGNNIITARLLSVGDAYQNAGAISYVQLGQANVLNIDRIRVALHKCLGTVLFAPGLSSPSVVFRNARGDGRQQSWEIGDEYEPDQTLGYFTSSQSTGVMDLTGGTVDALVDRITLGKGQTNAPTRTGDGNGTLTFERGVIDANFLEMGIQLSDGGSVGRGTLNVNATDPQAPATVTVKGDVVMAMQYLGNTDPSGSTAVINLNGGILLVGGSITNGLGTATINIDNGGKLDLLPPGDTSPGAIAVDVLNLNNGLLVNYSTLAVSNINLGSSISQFTVAPGQTLVPVAVGTTGTLSVNGDLNAGGTLDLDIRKDDGVLATDNLQVGGVADLGGTIRVRYSGNSPLAAGDKFTLVTAQFYFDSTPTFVLPNLGPGLTWTNNLLVDGSIEVIASGEPATPPTLTVATSPTSFTLSWPEAYTSYSLRGQTNPLSIGLTTNWARVLGVVGNQITIQRDPANGSVFFQLQRDP